MGMADTRLGKLTEAAQEHLSSENVALAIPGFGRNPWLWAGLGLIGASLAKPRSLIVTDQMLRLLKTGSIKASNYGEELASAPVGTPLGELDGMYGKLEFPNGELVYIPKVFFSQTRTALGS